MLLFNRPRRIAPLSYKSYSVAQSLIWTTLIVLYLLAVDTNADSSISTSPRNLDAPEGSYTGSKGQDVVRFLRQSRPIHISSGELPEHLECAEVHKAKDQCAWVREKCEDQDSSFLSYLQLYYCSLPQAKPLAMIIMLLWLSTLFSTIGIAASDYFCVNLSTISTILGLSESVTGVTLLAFGNGSPDVFSTWAAMSSNSGSMAIGELIGAASFITALVAGSMAIIRPFKVAKKSFIRDLGFFIVATAFSLGFLIDGHLELWECIVMVVYYVIYVTFVIVWHWRSTKSKARKARDQAAREHFMTPEYTDNPPEEEDEEDATVGANRGRALEDEFTILERSERNLDDDDEDDDTRDRYMAELTTSMRISRPRGVSRENTRNPIRPSLVGALEFRAVLSSLERSRSQLSIPLFLRRYSDDAITSLGQQHRLDRANSDLDPIAVPSAEFMDQGLYRDEPQSGRPRAVSTNALDNDRTPTTFRPLSQITTQGFEDETSPNLLRLQIPNNSERTGADSLQTTSGHLSPASAERSPYALMPESPITPSADSGSPTSLQRSDSMPRVQGHGRGSSSEAYFTPYHDEPNSKRRSRAPSLMLPTALIHDGMDVSHRPIKWWPRRWLPPPEELWSTLFPTLCSWKQKSYSQKILGLLTAPSVLILNITLPVVESNAESVDEKLEQSINPVHPHSTGRENANRSKPQTPLIRTQDSDGHTRPTFEASSDIQSNPSTAPTSTGWHRWLLCIQLIFAPLFVVTTIWINFDEDHDTQTLLVENAIALVVGLLSLLIVLLTTNEKTPPRYRPIFCAVGFAVSISWISTIANEVVGVLKALGIILNISEAILGLTVFAIGSSLGDLVADITIARLGYPMMALSACFGGPMLNILLGVGTSGIYLLLQRGKKYHHKHPDAPIKYKSYHIAIDPTLMVSSATLLLTLIGLAIAVPLNGWRMSRRIGWALIIVWVISTAINLGIEVGGLGKGSLSALMASSIGLTEGGLGIGG